MSFTTRCPACGTTFKIVPDQLKISDGWVRCGHCADVFDATLFLEGGSATGVPVTSAPPDAPVVPAPVPALDDNDGDWLLPPAPPRPTFAPAPVGRSVPAQPVSAAEAFEDELRQFAQPGSSDLPEALASQARPSVVVDSPDLAVEAATAQQGYDVPIAPEPSPDELDDVPDEEALLPVEPGFVRQARRRAFWRSRGMRAALVVVSLLLALGLLAQHAVHERDSLAARFPASIPVLEALCLPTGCQIGPLRQIESVVIDSSNLVRRLGNFYSFDFVLKNSARMPVAVPALELSLTDTREAVIVRRVFLPDELPGAPRLLPAQGSLSLSLRLSIADQGVSSMSGYRALVFYP